MNGQTLIRIYYLDIIKFILRICRLLFLSFYCMWYACILGDIVMYELSIELINYYGKNFISLKISDLLLLIVPLLYVRVGL